MTKFFNNLDGVFKYILLFILLFLTLLLIGNSCSKISNQNTSNNITTKQNKVSTTTSEEVIVAQESKTETSSHNLGIRNPKKLDKTPKINSKESEANNKENYYEVVRIIDGDTIVVNYNNKKEKVRLVGLDTTESKDPRKKAQCFSREASSKIKELVSNKQVRLEQGQMSSNRGYFGRLLRYVYLPDGTLVNAWMIRQGYGYAYIKYPFSKMEEFTRYQRQAKENKLGLWAEGVCEKKKETSELSIEFGKYICYTNKYNCSDFDSYSQAKEVYEACGGVNNDIHRLDSDGDNRPCESLGY